MAINNITQTISTLPPAGSRGVDVQTQFVIKQEDFQDHLQGITVTELNTLKDQLNSRIGEINSTATTMNGYADTASAGASTATTKAGEASTSASDALAYKNQAETFKNNASASATKASQWADNNYNVEVETGKYSAKHWSTVAQNATANKIDKVTSTDNAIVRFDGATGQVQNSSVVIDDSGYLSISPSITLPSTAGSKITAFSKYTQVDNKSYLRFDTVRTSAGSSHESSEERIQKVVDVTEMGYIGFGANTVKLGTGSGDKVILDDNGNVGIGTSVLNNKLEVNGSIGFGSTTGYGRIHSDANWGCLLQSDVSSPVIAEFAFLNNAAVPLAWIDTAGNLLLKSGNGGLGYGTGAGGTVTQLTSKSTAVTLNKPTGQITMNNAALAAGASVIFILSNSLLGSAVDNLLVTIPVPSINQTLYEVKSYCGNAGAYIVLKNISAGSLSDDVLINFTIIKGANS